MNFNLQKPHKVFAKRREGTKNTRFYSIFRFNYHLIRVNFFWCWCDSVFVELLKPIYIVLLYMLVWYKDYFLHTVKPTAHTFFKLKSWKVRFLVVFFLCTKLKKWKSVRAKEWNFFVVFMKRRREWPKLPLQHACICVSVYVSLNSKRPTDCPSEKWVCKQK